MKRIVSAIIASMTFLCAHAASAQTFVTTPGTYTFASNSVAIQKGGGPLLACNMSIDVVNNGTGIHAENAIITGGSFCFTATFQNAPWPVTVSGSTVTISGLYVATGAPSGDCAGFLDAAFSVNGTTEELLLTTGFDTTSTLPQVSEGGDCKIDGILEY